MFLLEGKDGYDAFKNVRFAYHPIPSIYLNRIILNLFVSCPLRFTLLTQLIHVACCSAERCEAQKTARSYRA